MIRSTVIALPSETQGPTAKRARRRRGRRGATAMEYLVVITFILVALIMGVQHFGSWTGKLFGKNANATANTVNGP